MSTQHPDRQDAQTVSLADEEAVKQVLVSTVLGLWDIVNNLTRLKPSKRERYRVTIFDPTGKVLFEAAPTESLVALPDSVVLSSGIQYLWKVEAQIGPGRSVSSELVSFTLRGARP